MHVVARITAMELGTSPVTLLYQFWCITGGHNLSALNYPQARKELGIILKSEVYTTSCPTRSAVATHKL